MNEDQDPRELAQHYLVSALAAMQQVSASNAALARQNSELVAELRAMNHNLEALQAHLDSREEAVERNVARRVLETLAPKFGPPPMPQPVPQPPRRRAPLGNVSYPPGVYPPSGFSPY